MVSDFSFRVGNCYFARRNTVPIFTRTLWRYVLPQPPIRPLDPGQLLRDLGGLRPGPPRIGPRRSQPGADPTGRETPRAAGARGADDDQGRPGGGDHPA